MMKSFLSEALTMTEGREVEISYNKNGGVWYKALIEAKLPPKPKSRRKELLVRLLKDHEISTRLKEITDKVSFRPIPPKNIESRVGITKGTIVDSYNEDGWWTGLVVRENGYGKFFVFFDSPPDIIQFHRNHLRPHLDWVDEDKLWIIPGKDTQFLRKSTEEAMFSPGAMVEVMAEVSYEINISETVWRPAMIVKEMEEDDEKKFIVKICEDPFSCKSFGRRPNRSVDLHSLRPRPPPCRRVGEYEVGEYIEIFHGREWRQGQARGRESVPGFLYGDWRSVLLEATHKELCFKKSDLRPLKVWEDGVWKSRESALTERSGNMMSAKETTSSGMNATPMMQTEAETQTKTLMSNQNGSGNDSTRENENSEDDNRKRKRDDDNVSCVGMVEENEEMVLPFEKKLPIWETFESMSVFKAFPQSPHFKPLVEISEDSRETFAVGLMFTFSGLVEQLQDLKPDKPLSSVIKLSVSLSELGKHGFDIKLPMLRINKLLSLRDKKAKKTEELKDAERVIAEKESLKVENERKILQLQRLNKEVDKEIAKSKSLAATIVQELEDIGT